MIGFLIVCSTIHIALFICTWLRIHEQNMNRFFTKNIHYALKSELVHDIKNKIFFHEVINVKGKAKYILNLYYVINPTYSHYFNKLIGNLMTNKF